MDRHGITAALGPERIFTTLHEAIAAVRGGTLVHASTSQDTPGKDQRDGGVERQRD
jgi:hypothetical protein